jgi:Family of unknown function (DUF6263)
VLPSFLAHTTHFALSVAAAALAAIAPPLASAQAPVAQPTAVVPASARAPQVTLAPKFEPGVEQRFQLVMENRRQTSPAKTTRNPNPVGGQTMTYLTTADVLRRVRESDATGTTIILIYERVKLKVSVDNESMDFDTKLPPESDPDKDMGSIIRGVINKPVEIRLDAAGLVESITGNEYAFDKVAAAQSLMSSDIFRDTLMPIYGLRRAPASARVGQSWSRVDRTPVMRIGTVVATVGHTLESLGDPMALVAIKGDVELVPAVGSTVMKAEVKSAALEGSAKWDSSLGLINRYNVVQTMNYTVEAERGLTDISNRVETTITHTPAPTSTATPAPGK